MILAYLFEFVDCFSALGDSGHEVGGGRAGEVLPHLADEVMYCDHARHLEALLNLRSGSSEWVRGCDPDGLTSSLSKWDQVLEHKSALNVGTCGTSSRN